MAPVVLSIRAVQALDLSVPCSTRDFSLSEECWTTSVVVRNGERTSFFAKSMLNTGVVLDSGFTTLHAPPAGRQSLAWTAVQDRGTEPSKSAAMAVAEKARSRTMGADAMARMIPSRGLSVSELEHLTVPGRHATAEARKAGRFVTRWGNCRTERGDTLPRSGMPPPKAAGARGRIACPPLQGRRRVQDRRASARPDQSVRRGPRRWPANRFFHAQRFPEFL